MHYQWQIRTLSSEQQTIQQALSKSLNISPAAARLLVVRGVKNAEEARAFVRPSLSMTHNPMQMKDMDKAVERLHRAIVDGEKIMVYGDYDVDGTTAVALMVRFLTRLTNRLDYYIPDRYKEGYGISQQGVDYTHQSGCTLMIALDCGIKAVERIDYANKLGVDVIVCDHHTPGDELPRAVAVLNMKRSDCPYPFKDLSGCGVGYKLAEAYSVQYGLGREALKPLLQLLAMSITSDIVSMVDENRILTYYGLKQMNHQPYAGVEALIEVAGIEKGKVNTGDLGFKIGPRINACGRVKSGREAVQLLLSDDKDASLPIAQQVDKNNAERREFDQQTTDEALEMLRNDPQNESRYTTVVYSPHWHKGVVGISASRLTETYYRPTIVLTQGEGDIISGSARSVGGFDLYSAIDSCRDLLTNFGGHAFAAGLSMHLSDLDAFKERFEHYVATHIQDEQRSPTLQIESEISLEDIDNTFYNIIRHLEPFGPLNPAPMFVTRGLINHQGTRVVGKQLEHLHLDLTDRTAAISGIAFGRADMAEYIRNGNKVDVCYELQENTFNHCTSIQMMVSDIQRSK